MTKTAKVKYHHIAIEGNIGVGKTTLAKLLARRIKFHLILERFRNNYFLPLFYNDMERYGLHVELSFFIDRLECLENFKKDSGIVSDYFFAKTLLFSKNNLDKHSFKIFDRVYKQFEKTYKHPDLILYLYRNTSFLLENIKKRGRKNEDQIQEEYLLGIEKSYRAHFAKQKKQRILLLDIGGTDFNKENEKLNAVVKLLEQNFPAGITKLKL